MATWVEDIVQALKNLGGQASLAQVYEEVKRIRIEPLPPSYKASIRERIEAHSSDSSNFNGKDLFWKVEKGIWALKAQSVQLYLEEDLSTWIEDVTQALINLGGQATNSEICSEVKRIRTQSLPKTWENSVMTTIYNNTADNPNNPGMDLFRWVAKSTWALQDPNEINRPVLYQKSTPTRVPPATKIDKPINGHNFSPEKIALNKYIPPESIEEITNILQTIKQYRDYSNPDFPEWKDYVKEFFQILGFSIEEVNQRLLKVNVMGTNHTPRALALFINPGENFDEMVPGLSWESYLDFASNNYQNPWGIITDGVQLKIKYLHDSETIQPFFWPDFDGVIRKESIDTFCTIFKVFSYIQRQSLDNSPMLPADQSPMIRKNKDELTDQKKLRLEFWRQLLDKAKLKTNLHANRTPNDDNWISGRIGINGFRLSYVIRNEESQVHLYIDRGEGNWNNEKFNALLHYKNEIENEFGFPLEWQLLPNNRACRIRYLLPGYGLKDIEHWNEIQDRMIDKMVRLEQVFRIYCKKVTSD